LGHLYNIKIPYCGIKFISVYYLATKEVHMVEMSFGERIALLRRRQGMTQREVAEESGVHRNTIARLERGVLHDLPGSAVGRLARALGTSADFLLGLTDNEEPSESEAVAPSAA
jgi:DNA-binding XRE family transcriptional regulator